MKILTDKKLERLLKNEYDKGYELGVDFTKRHSKDEWGNGFRTGLEAFVNDIQYVFENSKTPEEFCDWIYEKFIERNKK